jgi:hypothetical protein
VRLDGRHWQPCSASLLESNVSSLKLLFEILLKGLFSI